MGVLLCLGGSAGAQAVDHPLKGEWIDERGADLSLAVSGDQVTGSYSPEIISADCLDGDNKVVGAVRGDIVGLSITFEKCDVIMSMIGQLTETEGRESLYVSWVMNSDIADEFEDQALWASFMFGTSTFEKHEQ